METSSDSEENVPQRPGKRPRRTRRETQTAKQTLNSQEIGIMRGSNEAKYGSRFIGSGSGIHFIRTVYGMLAGNPLPPVNPIETTSPTDAVPGEDDELTGDRSSFTADFTSVPPPDTELWMPGEVAGVESEDNNPTFDDLISWTKSYFENWHPIFPFVHAPSILGIFDTISKHGIERVMTADVIIIRAIISIGLADSRQAPKTPPRPPVKFVFATTEQLMANVQFAICQPATLHNLQALFAAQLFLVSMLKFNFASRIGGAVVRMSFHLGLHRCPTRFRNFSAQENQVRRRIFFCVYCLDRVLCQSLGLPLGINDTDIDVCYPGEESHPLISSHLTQATGDAKQLLTLTLFAKHAKIRGMILELRNKSIHFRHETAKGALKIEAELSKWSNQLHESIDDVDEEISANETSSCPISELHKMYLQLLEHESTIALSRPLITTNKSSTSSMSALQTCIKASRSIIALLDDYRVSHSLPNTVPSSLTVPVTWPLVTWCSWMSCFILAYAALEGRSKLQFAIKYTEKSLNILKHLSLRKTRWPDLCGEAVQHVKAALVKKVADSNDMDPHEKERPISSRQFEEQISPEMRPPQNLHLIETEATLAYPSRGLSTSTDRVHGATSHNQQSSSDLSYINIAESPDTVAALPGRHSTQDPNSSFSEYFAGDFGQGILDPFSAIDFSNFSMANYNLMGDFSFG